MSDATARWLAAAAPIHVEVSPDGLHVAVTVARVPVGDAEEQLELLIVDVASRAVTPLAAAVPGDHTATWSPDGSRLAFTTERTGTPQLAVCAPDDAAAQVVTSLPAGVTGPASWSVDNRLVVAGRRGRQIDRTQPWRITRAVQWFDGIGALDDPPQLWVCDPATGAARTRRSASASSWMRKRSAPPGSG